MVPGSQLQGSVSAFSIAFLLLLKLGKGLHFGGNCGWRAELSNDAKQTTTHFLACHPDETLKEKKMHLEMGVEVARGYSGGGYESVLRQRMASRAQSESPLTLMPVKTQHRS